MATLYLENVPDELYEALRKLARRHRKSIVAEVVSMLEQNVPTARELQARRESLLCLQRLRSRRSPSAGPFPSTEEMVREDRER